MEQIIPDNENIEDYFDEDEIDMWSSLEDSYEFGILEDFRGALNRWVDDIFERGVPENTKIQHTTVDEKNYSSRCIIFL